MTECPHDYIEKEVLRMPHDFLIFLDEVGDASFHHRIEDYADPSIFPVLTILAVVFTKEAYAEILMPGLDEIKEYFFKDKKVVLHSREIRRKDGIYKIFLNEKNYGEFKSRMVGLLTSCSAVMVSSSINKVKLLDKIQEFKASTGGNYNIGDLYLRNTEYVLERVGHFLKNKTGKIIFETKGLKESRRIQGVMSQLKHNGSFYHGSDRFVGVDEDISFFSKYQNVNGLQIADYCAYPFSRHAKNPLDRDNKLFDILRNHVYKGDFGLYGLKEWP